MPRNIFFLAVRRETRYASIWEGDLGAKHGAVND